MNGRLEKALRKVLAQGADPDDVAELAYAAAGIGATGRATIERMVDRPDR